MGPVAELPIVAGAVVDVEVTGTGTVTVSGTRGSVVDGEDVVAVDTPQPGTMRAATPPQPTTLVVAPVKGYASYRSPRRPLCEVAGDHGPRAVFPMIKRKRASFGGRTLFRLLPLFTRWRAGWRRRRNQGT